jgi:hypothetical protein
MTNHALRLHGRDDHAPLFRAPARQRNRSPGRDILRHVPFLSLGVATSPITNLTLRPGAHRDAATAIARQRSLKTYKLKT